MKRLVTVLLSLVAVASFGQSSFGVRLFGFQSSSLSDAQMLYKNSAWPYDAKGYVGFLVGPSVRYQLPNQNHLTFELLFSMKGQTSLYETGTVDGFKVLNLSNGRDATVKFSKNYAIHYVEVPVLYTIDLSRKNQNTKTHVHFSAGVSAAFNTAASLTENTYSASGFSAFLTAKTTETTVSDVKPFTMNLITDLEVEFRRHRKARYFGFLRYTKQMGSTFQNSSHSFGSFAFGFGMRWKFKN
ncbi:MAG: outer membrane beta-barrel protein [Cytophagales bacterium]